MLEKISSAVWDLVFKIVSIYSLSLLSPQETTTTI